MAKLVDVSEFIRLPRPALEWTIQRLVPRPGLVVLMGPPKVGKSYLALQVAFAVARGEAFLGQPTTQGVVWYLQLDTSEFMWRVRLQDLEDAGTNITGPVKMAHPEEIPRPYNVLTTAFQTYIRNALKQEEPSMIIIDVLRKAHSADENDSTEMKRAFDVINDLFQGRSLFIVHHTRKIKEDTENPDPNSLSRGSSFITGEADALWLLFNGKLKVISRFDDDRTYSCKQDETGLWKFADEYHIAQSRSHVFSLCKEFLDLTHNKIAPIAKERWGMSRATYYKYLSPDCPHSGKRQDLLP